MYLSNIHQIHTSSWRFTISKYLTSPRYPTYYFKGYFKGDSLYISFPLLTGIHHILHIKLTEFNEPKKKYIYEIKYNWKLLKLNITYNWKL